jgi:NTE family protein
MEQSKTALVLSGGGSLGAVQVGMLFALMRAGLQFDMVVGSSVGALNGAYFAANPTLQGVEDLAGLWRSLRKQDIFPISWKTGLHALLTRRDYLVDATALRSLIRRSLSIREFGETRIPLHVMATDALSGAEVLLSSGPLEDALLASTAIPVVFPPVVIEGRHLVDGGIASNTPIACAIRLGAKRVIVLPTGVPCDAPAPPKGMAAKALHSLNLMSMRQLDRDIDRYSEQAAIAVVDPLCPLEVSVFNFSETDALMKRAANKAWNWVQGGGLDRPGPLHLPIAHNHHVDVELNCGAL